MKLTPLEIKQQQFEKALRGYDVADVQAFLTLVSNEYEHLLTKNKDLESQIEKLTDRVKHYEKVEEALHETLQTTKESVSQKMEHARLEATNTTEKAQMEAEAIIKEANQQRSQIRQSILRLLDRRQEIITGIKSYLDNAKTSVEKFADDEMAIFELPKQEGGDGLQKEDLQDEGPTSASRFSFDHNTPDSDDDNAFPPGTDRLNDILDEID